MSEFIISLILIVLVVFAIDYETHEKYYIDCTQKHSYSRCFYDHVFNPN